MLENLRNLIERIAILTPDTSEKVSSIIKESLKVQNMKLLNLIKP